jgi:hypothetical protein
MRRLFLRRIDVVFPLAVSSNDRDEPVEARFAGSVAWAHYRCKEPVPNNPNRPTMIRYTATM